MANEKIPGLGLCHLALRTADFEKSKAFYTQTLGLKLRAQWGDPSKTIALLDLGDGTCMELFNNGTPDQPEGGFWHVALHCDDPDKAYETAIAGGATSHIAPKDALLGGIRARLAFVKGPDGEILEFFKEL